MRPEKEHNPQLTPQQLSFLEVENQCCLCGTPLGFTHETDELGQKITEKAHCPSCKIQLKEKVSLIH